MKMNIGRMKTMKKIKGYAVVDECGFCHGIFELKKQAKSCKDFVISASLAQDPQIIEGEDKITELVFATDGNAEWMETFYEVFPVDAGFKIKIPTEKMNDYMGSAVNNLACMFEEMFSVLNPKWTEDEIHDMVNKRLCETLECSQQTLDHILFGEYWIV